MLQIYKGCPEAYGNAPVLEPMVVDCGLGCGHEPDHGDQGDQNQFLIAQDSGKTGLDLQETNRQLR